MLQYALFFIINTFLDFCLFACLATEKKKFHSFAGSLSKWPGLSQVEAESWELNPGVLGGRDPILELSLTASQGSRQQEAGIRVRVTGHRSLWFLKGFQFLFEGQRDRCSYL